MGSLLTLEVFNLEPLTMKPWRGLKAPLSRQNTSQASHFSRWSFTSYLYLPLNTLFELHSWCNCSIFTGLSYIILYVSELLIKKVPLRFHYLWTFRTGVLGSQAARTRTANEFPTVPHSDRVKNQTSILSPQKIAISKKLVSDIFRSPILMVHQTNGSTNGWSKSDRRLTFVELDGLHGGLHQLLGIAGVLVGINGQNIGKSIKHSRKTLGKVIKNVSKSKKHPRN